MALLTNESAPLTADLAGRLTGVAIETSIGKPTDFTGIALEYTPVQASGFTGITIEYSAPFQRTQIIRRNFYKQ